MRKLLALFVGVALLTVSLPSAGLHVHASTGSDASEHVHGPAVHEHRQANDHHADHPSVAGVEAGPRDVVRVEADHDTVGRVVPCSFTCVARAFHVLAAVLSGSVEALPPPQAAPTLFVDSDVRTHSPPRLSDGPRRAPPSFLLA